MLTSTCAMDERNQPSDDHKLYIQYKYAKREFRRAHGQKVKTYLNDLEEDFDGNAETDSCAFWKLVNRKRKTKPQLTFHCVEYSGAKVDCRPLVPKVPGSSPVMSGF